MDTGVQPPPPTGPPAHRRGHPVWVTVADDLERSRLTVGFRLILVIPHLLWAALWSFAAVFVAMANWVATLITGRPPDALHEILTRYIRYLTHVSAYLYLGANPFPGFAGVEGTYPIDVHFDPPARQNRWKTGFRLILAFPAIMFATTLFGSGGARSNGYNVAFGLIAIAGFLGWFAILARGRMPHGLRDAVVYPLSYSAQLDAYLMVVTDRYPNADPAEALGTRDVPPHPVTLTISEGVRRSRLTVFFRLLLALPHILWLVLWGIAAWIVAIVNWFVTLFAGRSPEWCHRFLSAYVRYGTHVVAFLFVLANPFPGFVGREGTYPIDVQIAPRERQNRWKTGFRMILAIPALFVASAFSNVAQLASIFIWWPALFTARAPRGLRNAGAAGLRYQAQLYAYLYLLTDRYPFASPAIRDEVEQEAAIPPPPPAPPPPPPEPGTAAAPA